MVIKMTLVWISWLLLMACRAVIPSDEAPILEPTKTPTATQIPKQSTIAIASVTSTLQTDQVPLSTTDYLLFYTEGLGLYTYPPLSAVNNQPELQRAYVDINQSEGFVPHLLTTLRPQISPNGKFLAVPNINKTWLLNLSQAAMQPLVNDLVTVTWHPQGDYLAYTRGNTLYVNNLALPTPKPAILFQRPESLGFASWSPDGAWLAVVEWTGEGGPSAYLYNFWLVSPDSGEYR